MCVLRTSMNLLAHPRVCSEVTIIYARLRQDDRHFYRVPDTILSQLASSLHHTTYYIHLAFISLSLLSTTLLSLLAHVGSKPSPPRIEVPLTQNTTNQFGQRHSFRLCLRADRPQEQDGTHRAFGQSIVAWLLRIITA
jgi:hypothetical protein